MRQALLVVLLTLLGSSPLTWYYATGDVMPLTVLAPVFLLGVAAAFVIGARWPRDEA